MTAAVPQAATSENLATWYKTNVQRYQTSAHGTARISIVHPKLFDNSINDFVVTLLSIEELSGTTRVVRSVEGSLSNATKFDVLNSSI